LLAGGGDSMRTELTEEEKESIKKYNEKYSHIYISEEAYLDMIQWVKAIDPITVDIIANPLDYLDYQI
jgi:uncharacterized protein YnzC (UPF0291/DUF896 family)